MIFLKQVLLSIILPPIVILICFYLLLKMVNSYDSMADEICKKRLGNDFKYAKSYKGPSYCVNEQGDIIYFDVIK